MLAAPVRRLLPLLFLAAAVGLLSGCGEKKELNVKEGEPVEVGELSYNVRLTRFLNPTDEEDAAYLVGKQPAPAGKSYLGVFLRIENKGDAPSRPSSSMYLIDTRDDRYRPQSSRSLFALRTDRAIPPDGHVPIPSTPASEGDAGGLMVLFLVDDEASTNRPLRLVIPGGSGEPGKVELDI
jgi:hypothetical protein